ncbi:MAG: glycosyltransferase family 87 protein [Acidobacteriota bacterium]
MPTTLRTSLKDLFFSPIQNGRQIAILVLVAFLLVFIPQPPVNDWDINTRGFWSDFPNTYADPNRVYPPWGLILMIPYYLMRAEGARFLSGIVMGLLVIRRGWSLSRFLAIVLSPYFFWTLATSNMDVLVLVLPILIWEMSWGKRWQSIGRGGALSISLLKPQGMLFIWLYWFWSCRKQWKELIVPVIIGAGVVIPISLVGSPPLVIQWLNNLANPSPVNKLYWTINNVSLTARYSLPGALLILVPLALVFIVLARWRRMTWTRDHTLSSLLIASMSLSPYASQQGVAPALAFIPSWMAVIVQYIGLAVGMIGFHYLKHVPQYVLFFACVSLVLFIPRTENGKAQAPEQRNAGRV